MKSDISNIKQIRHHTWIAVGIGFLFHCLGIVQFFDIHVLTIMIIGSVAACSLSLLKDKYSSWKGQKYLVPILLTVNMAFGFYAGLLLYYCIKVLLT